MAQQRDGGSLSLPIPDISIFSDASDVGWGALVGEHHASGLWSPPQTGLSFNMRELLAVQYGLLALEHLLVGLTVALFGDNTTSVTLSNKLKLCVIYNLPLVTRRTVT